MTTEVAHSAMSALDPQQAEAIRRLVNDLAAEHGVTILWAIESGSRAWGFPSPDSDYDCRFLYLRPLADYLALSAPRDVIEVPVDSVLDVNGWDLVKALRLMLNGLFRTFGAGPCGAHARFGGSARRCCL